MRELTSAHEQMTKHIAHDSATNADVLVDFGVGWATETSLFESIGDAA